MCYLDGEVVVAGQRVGGDVQLRIFGDEFYARHETLDGHTVVYDTAIHGYCYATLASGHLVSSGVPISKPPPIGLRRHLKEDPEVRNAKFGRRYEKLRPREDPSGSSATRTFGPDDGLLGGRKLLTGAVRGLTILVEFADVETSITSADVDAMMNDDAYTENGNACSVKRYFDTVSSGLLDFTNTVVGPVRLSKRRSHYINDLFVEEALDAARTQFGVNLSDYDSRNEGVVDALTFLYAGDSQYSGELWPHNGVQTLHRDGVQTHFYMLTGLGTHKVDLRIGTICHENGHMLCRFPDMYDYGKRDGDHEKSQGIGRYCLMGSGNHLDNRRTPSPVSAYLRELAGWSTVVPINGAGAVSAPHGAYDKVFKFELDTVNEYFLVENRTRQGLDAHLPSSGLAIYHCDRLGSNEWQDGTRTRHYQCALLQADGQLDLESNVNAGDPDDLFADVAGVAASHDTLPSTRQWDGSDSGFTVSDVGAVGAVMSYRVGGSQVPVGTAETFPNLVIPDSTPAGIESELEMTPGGTVTAVAIDVHIIHSWIGDLTVTLVAPDGTAAVLHNREGQDGDDIHTTYRTGGAAALDAMTGKAVQGTWKLHVVDHASQDVGRLVQWGLRIEYEATASLVEGEAAPNVAIPDDDRAGIASSILFEDPGRVRDLRVSVDVEHTYAGDLEVDLVAPSGLAVRLHNREGWGRDNINRSYDTDSTPTLTGLAGEAVQGDWTLKVRDLAGADVGTLKNWSLAIET